MTGAFDLDRFVEAQAEIYPAALAELRRGRKTSHWMWFVFPQIAGLGRSGTAIFYAIGSAAQARAYLQHPLLGARLRECAQALLMLDVRDPVRIFGSVDAMKLRSSMTLFEQVADDPAPFAAMLDGFFGGERDGATLDLLGES